MASGFSNSIIDNDVVNNDDTPSESPSGVAIKEFDTFKYDYSMRFTSRCKKENTSDAKSVDTSETNTMKENCNEGKEMQEFDAVPELSSEMFHLSHIHPAVLSRGQSESIHNSYLCNGDGFVIVINFAKNREGSNRDVERLDTFFRNDLQFEVDIAKDNMTRHELRVYLENIRAKMNKRYYCFICIVMAHGNECGIMTDDDKVQPYNEIIETFNNFSMPEFAGRPKMILINACRGDRLQRIVSVDEAGSTDVDASLITSPKFVAETADLFVFYSTVSGFASTRDARDGSIFIQLCVDVFKKYHNKSHVGDMATLIKNKVISNYANQVSEVQTTLTKQFFLKVQPSEWNTRL